MKYHLYLASAMLIVGSSVTAGKFITVNTPVSLSMFLRFAVGSAVLYLFMVMRKERPARLSAGAAFLVCSQALLGSVLFNVFLLKGLKTVSAVTSGIISGFTPVMLTVLSFVLLREKPDRVKITASCIAAAGVIIASAESGEIEADTAGLLFVFAAVLSESLFLIMRRVIKTDISTTSLSLYLSLAGMFFFAFPAAGEMTALTVREYAVIGYYGVFITAAAYLLWLEGIKYVQASAASAYTAVMPVSAALTGVVFLGEPFLPKHFYGLVLVSAAIILTGKRR
ncbi:DMT family transporter [Geovibrio thiophilus]|uniref:DMT family transporter n=1 Tax=Geovibrio thiophilus TaxID=139438 RepID=A0A410JVR9_9BACT|nr:DMT family transporter [Geovibrio thiophilus]QAR32121.1 DMT family transporter [Geovibrio thiophilus]